MLMHTTDLVVPSGVLPHPAPAPTCTGHNTIPLNNVGWKEVEMKVNDLDILRIDAHHPQVHPKNP